MENEIFKYLNPVNNDKLSEFKGKDLLNVINLLNNDLELRDTIDLNDNITFGLELEFENIPESNYLEVLDIIKKRLIDTNWISKYDGTLNYGVEINSPALHDNKESWIFLNDLLGFLKQYVSVDSKSGGHIHIGTQILGDNKDAWLHLLKLWSIYENVIYRFTYGDYLTGRKGILEYAMPMMHEFYKYYDILKKSDIETIISFLKKTRRYQAINFINIKEDDLNKILYKNTIEFRSPNSSLNAIVWQNNVNLFTKMLLYCKKSDFDNNTIDNRFIINNHQYDNINLYDEIFLEQVLEFIDLIFVNNLDKIYFLKQYLKSFAIKKESSYTKNKILRVCKKICVNGINP